MLEMTQELFEPHATEEILASNLVLLLQRRCSALDRLGVSQALDVMLLGGVFLTPRWLQC
jgi:hypothetical protein